MTGFPRFGMTVLRELRSWTMQNCGSFRDMGMTFPRVSQYFHLGNLASTKFRHAKMGTPALLGPTGSGPCCASTPQFLSGYKAFSVFPLFTLLVFTSNMAC